MRIKHLINDLTINNINKLNIADQVIAGPQAEVLNKIIHCNGRYGTNLGITKTFRWSPGFSKQREETIIRMLGVKKGGKNTTFQNRISNSQWNMNHFLDTINEMEDILYHLRRNRIIFADNSHIIKDINTVISEKIISDMETINNNFDGISIRAALRSNHVGQPELNFTLTLEPYILKYNIGDSTIDLPMAKTEIMFSLELIYYYTRIISIMGADHDLTEAINLFPGGMNILGKYWLANYYNHPYIRRQYIHDNVHSIEVTKNDFQTYTSVCTGNFPEISRLAGTFELAQAALLTREWLSHFTEGFTNPLNNIRRAYAGWPEGLKMLWGSNRCTKIRDNLPSESYCNDIKCVLKDACIIKEITHKSYLSDESPIMSIMKIYFDDSGLERFQSDLSNIYDIQRLAASILQRIESYDYKDTISSILSYVYEIKDTELNIWIQPNNNFALNYADTTYEFETLNEFYQIYDERLQDEPIIEKSTSVEENDLDIVTNNDMRYERMAAWLADHGINAQ